MHIYFYEYMKRNKAIHHGIREYCLYERVNQEYPKTLIEKSNNISNSYSYIYFYLGNQGNYRNSVVFNKLDYEKNTN